jgi:cytochrome c2
MIRTLAITALLLCACEGGRTEKAYGAITGGDRNKGQELVEARHCGACHEIPGVRAAHGDLGPPLKGFARRTFIAGQIPNTPEHLVQWILDPHTQVPGTAMPTLGLQKDEARDIAAFLYTLN